MNAPIAFRSLAAALVLSVATSRADVIAHWNFNSQPPDGNANTGTLLPYIGTGAASLVGPVTASFTAASGSSDTHADNSNWRLTNWPPQGTGNKTAGIQFKVSTLGYKNIRIEWDQRYSNTASKYSRLQYTTNGADFLDTPRVITMPPELFTAHLADLGDLPGVANNPDFGLRIVTEFESTATGSGIPGYVAANSPASNYNPGASTLRFDMVTVHGTMIGPRPLESLSLLNYNVWGANAATWSTNSSQVRAIGRQAAHLNPDVITFQEIPAAYTYEMTNFVKAFLPGYFLATNSTSDGDKRNLIASRFPILRSHSHMGRGSLAGFGFNGVFTRDLFEAEIAVPGFDEPLHVFSVHLKAFNDPVSAPRRAAEASAISNHFATVFLPAKGHRPYVLAGDLNEDIDRPRSYEQDAVRRIVNDVTGLRLTTPLDPQTQDERTWSSRNPSPTIRFDYILPGGLLHSNLSTSRIFRTAVLNPLPAGVLATDGAEASDHLPLVMVFNNPYGPDFVLYSITIEGQTVRLRWHARPGRSYVVELSSNLSQWIAVSSAMTATGSDLLWTGSTGGKERFFRVRQLAQ